MATVNNMVSIRKRESEDSANAIQSKKLTWIGNS